MNWLTVSTLWVGLLLVRPAVAVDYSLGDLEVADHWTRATAAKVGAGYFTVTNRGAIADRLVSGSSPVSARVELHATTMTEGVMQMRPLPDGVPIPPGETVAFAAGGNHVMLVNLKEPLKRGSSIPLTLEFERAGRLTIELAVEAPGARFPSSREHDGHGQ
jgi:periplasmic copper chaperone A